jgi:hypothetical protein
VIRRSFLASLLVLGFGWILPKPKKPLRTINRITGGDTNPGGYATTERVRMSKLIRGDKFFFLDEPKKIYQAVIDGYVNSDGVGAIEAHMSDLNEYLRCR